MKKTLRSLIAVGLSLLLVCGMFPLTVLAEDGSGVITENVDGKLHEGMTRKVLELVNQEREKAKLEPLVMTAVQEQMAEQRAAELTALFEHTRPDGQEWNTVFGEYNLEKYDKAGENIAQGQKTAEEVMNSWMNSEGHKANILDKEFTHIGIGCFEYADQLYWVQIFTGNPSDTNVAAAEGEDNKKVTASYWITCTHKHMGEWEVSKAATCTEKGVEIRQCNDCKGKETRDIDATGHNFGEWEVSKAATCNEAGEESRKCNSCDAVETREIEATGHSYGEWQVVNAANCTAKGSEKRICSVCKSEETRETEALGHSFTVEKVTKEATCTEPGKKEIACENPDCKAVKIEEIPVQPHTPKETITDATCTQPGQRLITCSVCGEKLEAEVIPEKGHSFGEWKVTKAATWKTEGTQERICTECGEKESAVLPALSANHEHVYNGIETIVKQATCTEEGSKTIACGTAECDAKMTVSILPTGHYAGKWETLREATCSQVGKSVQKCNRCDAVIAEKAIAVKNHNYGEWEVVKEATTSAAGEKKRVCKDCVHVEKAAIKKLTADPEKKTTKASNDTKKNTSKNNVKTGDNMQPLYYVIGLAGAGAVISLILYMKMRRKEKD